MEPAAFGGRGLQGGLLLALTRGLWKSICTGAGICSVQGVDLLQHSLGEWWLHVVGAGVMCFCFTECLEGCGVPPFLSAAL